MCWSVASRHLSSLDSEKARRDEQGFPAFLGVYLHTLKQVGIKALLHTARNLESWSPMEPITCDGGLCTLTSLSSRRRGFAQDSGPLSQAQDSSQHVRLHEHHACLLPLQQTSPGLDRNLEAHCLLCNRLDLVFHPQPSA